MDGSSSAAHLFGRVKPARRALRRLAVALAIALAFVSSSATAAGGQGEALVTVRLDGRPVLRVGALDTLTAAARALRVERRLGRLLDAGSPLGAAQVTSDGSSRIITVAGVPVLTAAPSDAEDNVTTVDALAARWARALDVAIQGARERRGSRWERFGAEVGASVNGAFGRLAESAIRIVPRVLAAVLVIGLFWILAASVRWLLRALFSRIVDDRTVESLVKQLAYYAIWALGLVVAIDALGFPPQTVVTGLGLTGLALGFALKDIISNFVSGLLLLALRPFELGDQIVVGDTEGSVERIELRATHIRAYDGRLVLVPNAELFTSRVTNNTASPLRRATVELWLGYDTDLRAASTAVLDTAQRTTGVLADPPASVHVRELGQDDVILEARFWTDSRRADHVATQSAVRSGLIDALRDAGIKLPDPDVRIIVPASRPG